MPLSIEQTISGIFSRQPRAIGRAISLVENQEEGSEDILAALAKSQPSYLLLGITGPPGAGKSTLTSALITSLREQGERLGIIAIDPSSPLSGGAILGDRVRMMRHAEDKEVVIRSMATRGRLGGLCAAAGAAVQIMAASGCSTIIIETVGVGQSEMDIVALADLTMLALAPGLGDGVQAMKAGLLEVVDLLVVNKSDLRGAESLAMDLAQVAREREQNQGLPTRLCRTVASEGTGLEELITTIHEVAGLLKKTGEIDRRRQLARQRQVEDLAVELVRQKLRKQPTQIRQQSTPLQQAQHLLEQIGVHLS